MIDETEEARRILQAEVNVVQAGREELEKKYGKVWDTAQLRADFEVVGFAAPFVGVIRKSDLARGWMTFQHSPRFYFDFFESGK